MTANVDIRVTRARSQLITEHPFFGALAMRLVAVMRTDIKTLATEGKHLFYNPAWLDRHQEPTILMGIAHEVLHCALGHHTRRANRDPERWNIACDHVVNLMLHKAGFAVPDWAYCDHQYDGLNAEQVYRLLEQEELQQMQGQQPEYSEDALGQNPDGSLNEVDEDGDDSEDEQCESQQDDGMSVTSQDASADGDAGSGSQQSSADGEPSGSSAGTSIPQVHGDPGGLGEVLDAAPAHDQAALDEMADEWQVYTRQAANVARRAGEGKLPGFIEEVIAELDDPKTDWRSVLRRFVDPSSTKDYSWASPNKRYMSMGFYTPGLVSDGVNHVAMLIDTSGSIDTEWLKKFGAEVQAALDDGAIDKVTLVFADDVVHKTAEYVRGGELIDFTAYGRGGTRFAPAFEWVNENAPDASVAIYFTDLECSVADFGPSPAYPVLWAAYGYDPRVTQAHMARVPFGECVELQ